MSDITDVLLKYLAESSATQAQALADANASQEKILGMQMAQADKSALKEELTGLKSEAVLDTFGRAGDYLVNWFKVDNSHAEAEARAYAGLPAETDLEAQIANKSLGQNLTGGMDYKTDADEIADSDKDATNVDLDPNNDNIDADIDQWAQNNFGIDFNSPEKSK